MSTRLGYMRLKQSGEQYEAESSRCSHGLWPSRTRFLEFAVCLLCLSFSLNIFQYRRYEGGPKGKGGFSATSTYAGLDRHLELPYPNQPREEMGIRLLRERSPYNTGNRSLDDLAWSHPDLDVSIGAIALDDDFVQRHDLVESQRHPWNPSTSIYYISAFHNLHCVKMFRRTTLQLAEDEPVTTPAHHLLHCVDWLRDVVMCTADDLPLYTGFHYEQHEMASRDGEGQIRSCRDWSQLASWARENSACWTVNEENRPFAHESDRYKFCPT